MKSKPTWISSDGSKFWMKNGKPHRESGPAIIYPDGSEFWHLNGKRHRKDGPAVIKYNRNGIGIAKTEYWIHGVQYNFKEFTVEANVPEKLAFWLIMKYA